MQICFISTYGYILYILVPFIYIVWEFSRVFWFSWNTILKQYTIAVFCNYQGVIIVFHFSQLHKDDTISHNASRRLVNDNSGSLLLPSFLNMVYIWCCRHLVLLQHYYAYATSRKASQLSMNTQQWNALRRAWLTAFMPRKWKLKQFINWDYSIVAVGGRVYESNIL